VLARTQRGTAGQTTWMYQAKLRRSEEVQREAGRHVVNAQLHATIPPAIRSVEIERRDTSGVERSTFETGTTLAAQWSGAEFRRARRRTGARDLICCGAIGCSSSARCSMGRERRPMGKGGGRWT
jgi:hypothetical protein